MRFAGDAQLPPALARFLVSEGHEAEHVGDVGLLAAGDGEIWSYALAKEAAIIAKDEDFAERASLAAEVPQIVWLRIGKSSKRALLLWFHNLLPEIVAALESGERFVEIV